MIDVLLVEDEPAYALLISDMLAEARRGKFELHHAATLAEGLRKLTQRSYDLILTDLGLPDSQEFDTLMGLREVAPETPIVVLSASDDEDIALRVVQSGAEDYLVKDRINADALERVIIYAIERSRVREELRQSEHNYRILVEQSPDGIFVADLAGRLLDGNPCGCEMLGYSRTELLTRSISDLFEPMGDTEIIARVTDLRAGKTLRNEHIMRRKDGAPLPVELITRIIDGQRMQAIARDISQRKQAEQTLHNANQQALFEYQQLLNRIADLEQQLGTARDLPAVFRGLLDFLLVSVPCNGLFVSMYDPQRQERTCVYAWSEGQEEDVSTLPPLPMSDSPASRAVSSGEIIVTADFAAAVAGKPRVDLGLERDPRMPASSLAVPLLVMDRVLGAFEVQSVEYAAYRPEHVIAMRMAANIAAIATENVRLLQAERQLRIQAEASEGRFRDLVQGLDAIVWEGDVVAERFSFVSQQAETLLGYPIEQWISEQGFWINHIHPDDLEHVRGYKGAARTSENYYTIEYRMVAADGRSVWLRDTVGVVRDEAGQPQRLRGVIVDITELERVAASLGARARHDQAMAMLGQQALAPPNLPALLDSAVTLLAGALEVQFCTVMEMLPEGERLLMTAGFGWRPGVVGQASIDSHPTAAAGYTMLSDAAVIIEDWRTETRFSYPPTLSEYGVVSSISVLISNAAGHYGVMSAHSTSRRVFTADEANFMQAMANTVATTIETARADEALRKSERQFRAIFDNTLAAIFIMDDERAFLSANPAAGSLLGLPVESLTGLRMDDLIDVRQAPLLAPAWQNFLAGGLMAGEFTFRRPDGSSRIVQLGSTADVLAGQHLLSMIDITERKQAEEAVRESEQRSRAIIEQASDAIFITDASYNYVNVNEKACQLTGYSRQELLRLKPADIVVPGATREPAGGALGSSMQAEVVIRRRDGRLVPVEATGGVLNDGRVLAIVRDISERKQAEQDRQDRLTAIAANEAKSEFLAHMSHELRTPLNAILGFSQLLEMGRLDPEARESVAYIGQAGRHLLGLINDVLDMARTEAGKLSMSPEPVVLNHVLAECLDLTATPMAQRGIQLVVKGAGRGDHVVLADRQRLKQVLLNLLSNAVKYNHDGGKVIVEYNPQPGAVRVLISDTGPGLSPDKLARLFIAFDRLGAEGGGVEGTGLGLVITRQLIEAMCGRIGVESVEGMGSTFWVELAESTLEHPLTVQSENEIGHSALSLDPVTPAATRTLLYIEDNPASLSLVERILDRRPSIRLLSAHSGLGFELVRQQQVDMVLLDLHLPDISGEEVLQRLKADPLSRDIPVVILSADASAGTISRLLDAGAHHFLTKPLEVRRFLHILDELL